MNGVKTASTNSTAFPDVNRESPYHAPDLHPSRLWPVTIHVVCQRLCRTRCRLLHHSRRPILHRDRGRENILVRASLSLPNLILFTHTTQRNIRKLLVGLPLPNTTSFVYATWVDAHQGLVSASHRVDNFMQSREISVPDHVWIRSVATKVEHRTTILLPRIDRALCNSKQRLVRRFSHAVLLLITVEDVHHQSLVSPNCPVLRVRVRNLEGIRKRNADNTCCVCWVLRNITDPEAIDSAIRLVGTI